MALLDLTNNHAVSASAFVKSGLNIDLSKYFKTTTVERKSAKENIEILFWEKSSLSAVDRDSINYGTNSGPSNTIKTVPVNKIVGARQTFDLGTSETLVQEWFNVSAANLPDGVEALALSALTSGIAVGQTKDNANIAAFTISKLQDFKAELMETSKTNIGFTLFCSPEVYKSLKNQYMATSNASSNVLLSGELPMLDGIEIVQTQNAGFAAKGVIGAKAVLTTRSSVGIGYSVPVYDSTIKSGVSETGIPVSIMAYKNGPLDAYSVFAESGVGLNDALANHALKVNFTTTA